MKDFGKGSPLRKNEFVISADEKTSIQARNVVTVLPLLSGHRYESGTRI